MSPVQPPSAQHELSITRLIAAPPAKVFRAWSEPEWLMQWWGPHGWGESLDRLVGVVTQRMPD